jgi:hypothetical protein
MESQQEQQNQDLESAALMGQQEAVWGGSGIDLASGSFSRARSDTGKLARLDALSVRHAGEVEAYNYRVKAAEAKAERSMFKKAATNSLVGGFLNAGSSLASGYAKIKSPGRYTQGMR